MVNDPSSANRQRQPNDPNGATTQQGAGNLTQELAQLLAASIAQNSPNKRQPGGARTGTDVASLASLVSASTPQRSHAPAFKDGLSALAYTSPHPSPLTIERLPGDEHDDEPMPIPSTWREPASHDDERWFRQQMGAAVLGLVAGLMIVVPAVLWLSGFLGGPQKNKPVPAMQAAAPQIAVKTAEVKTVKVQVLPVERPESAAQYVASPEPRPAVEPRLRAEPARPVEPTTTTAALRAPEPAAKPAEPPPAIFLKAPEPARPHVEEVLAQVKRRIAVGDVTGARDMLSSAEGVPQGPVSFALAETYDPNMLAAWGSRGVVADVAKARSLYAKALDLGVSRARSRLDELK